jgi:hypothetical protein
MNRHDSFQYPLDGYARAPKKTIQENRTAEAPREAESEQLQLNNLTGIATEKRKESMKIRFAFSPLSMGSL